MEKAVAIPYVVALILGIIVIGLIGYWFVFQGGKTIGIGNLAQCESLCVTWRNSAFNVKPANIEIACKGQITGFAAISPPQQPEQPQQTSDILSSCKGVLGCLFKQSCDEGEADYGLNIKKSAHVCCKS